MFGGVDTSSPRKRQIANLVLIFTRQQGFPNQDQVVSHFTETCSSFHDQNTWNVPARSRVILELSGHRRTIIGEELTLRSACGSTNDGERVGESTFSRGLRNISE